MLQAHSFLWHYSWVAPNALLLILALLVWRRGSYKLYPAFFAFAITASLAELVCYGADLVPAVSANAWWHVLWASVVVESLLKFLIVAEIFGHSFRRYKAIAKTGTVLIRAVGVTLIFAAALAASFSSPGSKYGIVNGAHLLEQTVYLVETGLLVFVFLFAGYFHLRFSRPYFGIALGLAISASVHMAFWGLMANSALPNALRYQLDFIPMGTYHVVVLLWFYYLLTPEDEQPPTIILPPKQDSADNNLQVWNRELERLLRR
jgi:hypothetical protein